jgi:hypothetical protein
MLIARARQVRATALPTAIRTALRAYRSPCLLTVWVGLDEFLALEVAGWLAVVEGEKEILDDVLVLRECSL